MKYEKPIVKRNWLKILENLGQGFLLLTINIMFALILLLGYMVINQSDVIKQIDQNTVILQNQIDKLEERLGDTPVESTNEINVGYQ